MGDAGGGKTMAMDLFEYQDIPFCVLMPQNDDILYVFRDNKTSVTPFGKIEKEDRGGNRVCFQDGGHKLVKFGVFNERTSKFTVDPKHSWAKNDPVDFCPKCGEKKYHKPECSVRKVSTPI